MSAKEKIGWLQVALGVSLIHLFVHSVMSLIPGPKAEDGRVTITIMSLILSGVYLLILSWRAAYLAGKKR